jgi:hypothetical protein
MLNTTHKERMMIYIYTEGGGPPRVFDDVLTAKRHVEEHCCVTADENPQWLEHEDRWILAVRWRSSLAILWKVQVEGR